jgi:hypothetical protein
MRRRIKTDKDYILLLAKIYEVSFYIAQKFYSKANRIIEEAKVLISLYKMQTNCA